MIKEIRYGGVTTSPSDYECKDGDLALVSNMLTEGTALSTSTPPAAVENFGSAMPVYIHKEHYIYLDGSILKWRDKETASAHEIYTLATGETLKHVTSMGNVLVILTSLGMKYYVWDGDHYTSYGNGIPELNLQFTLAGSYYAYSGAEAERTSIDVEELDSFGYGIRVRNTEGNWNAIFGHYNKIRTQKVAENKFMDEFFVRYAIRMYDGSYVNISAPILMTPNAGLYSPLIGIATWVYSTDVREVRAQCYIADLQIKCVSNTLSQFSDIIDSVVIAVSAPLEKVNTGAERLITNESYNGYFPYVRVEGLSGEQLKTAMPAYGHIRKPNGEPIRHDYTEESWGTDGNYKRGYIIPPSFTDDEIQKKKAEVSTFYIIKEYKVSELDELTSDFVNIVLDQGCLSNLLVREQLPDSTSGTLSKISPSNAFVYNSRLNISDYTQKMFEGYNYALQEGFIKDRASSDNTYKKYAVVVTFTENGASYKATRVSPVSINNFADVRWFFYPHPKASLATIYEYTYNSSDDSLQSIRQYRLGLQPSPFLFGSYWVSSTPAVTYGPAIPSHSYAWKNGGRIIFTADPQPQPMQRVFNSDYEYIGITGQHTPDFSSIQFNLEMYARSAEDDMDIEDFPEFTDYSPTISYPNQVKHSEVNNPFFFPSAGTSQIPAERVIALRPATMALSENQYGDNDLYVFTTDGVFAFKVAADGRFSNVKVVTRDVVNGNGESITQLDRSILFATQRGIMELAGQTTQCLSNDLDAAMQPVDSLVPSDWAGEKPSVPFGQFIGNCRMTYEYIGQRVIVFNPDKDYSYAYNIKSHKYTLIPYGFDSTVNSYPESLVVGKSGNDNVLYDLSTMQSLAPTYEWKNGNTSYYTRTPAPLSGTTYYTDRECTAVGGTITSVGASTIKVGNTDYTLCRYEGWIISRPISLDSPNEYKILDYVRQNGVFDGFSIDGQQSDLGSLGAIDENLEEISGNFKSDAIQQVVYASNDLRHWKRIASSNSHRVSCMYEGNSAPTQFRWFRVAVRCRFVPGDVLASATFAFRTKFDNVKLL